MSESIRQMDVRQTEWARNAVEAAMAGRPVEMAKLSFGGRLMAFFRRPPEARRQETEALAHAVVAYPERRWRRA